MSKSVQRANYRISTPKQITDSLLNGAHEMAQFNDVFGQCTPKARRVLQELIDRIRPLQLKVRSLECQIEHLKTRLSEANDTIYQQRDTDSESL